MIVLTVKCCSGKPLSSRDAAPASVVSEALKPTRVSTQPAENSEHREGNDNMSGRLSSSWSRVTQFPTSS